MNVGGLGQFQVAEKRLAWVDQRQKVLAQNVANADTPGWKARDIGAFAKQLERTGAGLVRTDPMHLRPIGPAGGTAQPVKGERAPDGNSVSLDEQLAAIADTESAHGLTSDLYRKYLSFFRLAIGR